MTLRIRDTAALRLATEARVRKADGSLNPIDRMMIRTPDGLSLFYRRGIRLSANPTEVSGYATSSFRPAVTSAVTVSVDGGTAPYSHAWTVSAGSPASANSPSSATTTFTCPGTGDPYSSDVAFFTDTVTDANGLTAQVMVQADFSWGR